MPPMRNKFEVYRKDLKTKSKSSTKAPEINQSRLQISKNVSPRQNWSGTACVASWRVNTDRVELERAKLVEEHQSTLAALNADLAEVKTDVDAAQGALEEERQSSDQRDASYTKQVQILEKRLEAEATRLEERIVVVDLEHIQLDQGHQLALATVI